MALVVLLELMEQLPVLQVYLKLQVFQEQMVRLVLRLQLLVQVVLLELQE
jgi:hypothetical protein